ncbi:MAG: hypothetical protein AB7N99_05590 [Simkaniaceae bacterium]|nr:hypothetical protein [Chlamydiia bacterium]
MKRKVVNPDIQQKKHQQAVAKDQEKDLKHELQEERSAFPKKIPKKRPKTGHK